MNIFIIHGAYGTGEENWIPWLKEELEQEHHRVIVPRFPTPQHQTLENWLNVFEECREHITQDSIFIGHSIGCAFILSLLETLNIKIKGCIFVAGFVDYLNNEVFDELNKTFVDKLFDWNTIYNNCEQFYVLQSKDDPYVDFLKGVELSRNLKTLPIPYDNAGHFNSDAGFDTFEDLLFYIEKIKKFRG
ncbi:MAG: RBBP9/YdeN family alpha/beta hydrolase [Candidatus Nanoarchaeia archaeon]